MLLQISTWKKRSIKKFNGCVAWCEHTARHTTEIVIDVRRQSAVLNMRQNGWNFHECGTHWSYRICFLIASTQGDFPCASVVHLWPMERAFMLFGCFSRTSAVASLPVVEIGYVRNQIFRIWSVRGISSLVTLFSFVRQWKISSKRRPLRSCQITAMRHTYCSFQWTAVASWLLKGSKSSHKNMDVLRRTIMLLFVLG